MDLFATEAFTLLAVGIAVILFRTYARVKVVGWKGLEADDFLMLLVIIPYSIETSIAYATGASAKGLMNSGMTDQERAALSHESEEYKLR